MDEVEHRDALRSVLCPEGAEPFVEVVVRLADGSTHTMRRTLHVDGATESTTTCVDGLQVADFASLGGGNP